MKNYSGGCHCGAVRYEVETDLAQVMECNCSYCRKQGWLLTFVPAAQFTLLSGEENLQEYRFNKKHIEHLFCKTCGISSFSRGKDQEGNLTFAVNVRCLDDLDLSTLTITKVNGKDF